MPSSYLEPANEHARLLIIQKYRVPTAFQEPIFQELTTLAAHIFGLPVAFLSLVDGVQVDFPATYGVLDLHTLPREAALCSTAVQQHTTVVLNAISQSQGSDSPQWQTAQRFRMEFYAGAPVLVEQQYAIGALCLSDHRPRVFSAQQELVLTELAAIVSQAVSWRTHCLAGEAGEPRWQATQQVAVEDIRLLQTLIQHLRAQHADSVLHVVQRRLLNLKELVSGASSPLPYATSASSPAASAAAGGSAPSP